MNHSLSPFLQKFMDFCSAVIRRLLKKKETRCLLLPLMSVATVLQPTLAQIYPVPRGSNSEWLAERHLILGTAQSDMHPEIRPFSRIDVGKLGFEMLQQEKSQSADSIFFLTKWMKKTHRRNYQYLVDDNAEFLPDTYIDTTLQADPSAFGGKPKIVTTKKSTQTRNARALLRYFYTTPANLFEVATPHFRMKVNPFVHLHFGSDHYGSGLLFENQRGLEIRGDVDAKAYFFTNILESQARLPEHVNQFVRNNNAIPGNGLFKFYDSRIFNNLVGYDFLNAQGAVGFRATPHIGVELGHGRHQIGNGYRSLFLSDFAHNYFYLKLNTRVWKFHYQNIFTELTPSAYKPAFGDSILPKKYAAIHYLNFKIMPRLSVGLFEATVFNRSQVFELQYLNPVILYRTVEQAIGSPDNILLGLDARWEWAQRVQVYAQLLIDEFSFSFLYKPQQRGYWGNKAGVQLGAKYINVLGINRLDLQVELNRVRPFTYSHSDTLNAYMHYRQSLAHPLGANFQEWLAIIRYQPIHPLTFQLKSIHAKYGENPTGENYGFDPLLSNLTRHADFGNTMFQGVRTTHQIWTAEISYQVYHNMFLDVKWFSRSKNSALATRDLKTHVFSAGIRINLWRRDFDF